MDMEKKMSKQKRNVTYLICDICKTDEIDYGIDTYGLRIVNATYYGPDGGGGFPKDTFICQACVVSKHIHISDLTATIWKDD